jgi:predicted ester cyclase
MREDIAKPLRRGLLGAGLAAGVAALALIGKGAAAQSTPSSSGGGKDIWPFAKIDEADLRADDRSLPPRARRLIRIGEVGISGGDEASLREFFHSDFRFHGPRGGDLDREALWRYFAACRAAFDDFTVTRQTLVSDGGDFLAARTRFAGRFARPFTPAPGETIAPNGKPFEYRLLNIFRYAPNGQLIEEWAQYDVQPFLDQLHAR